ncbi:MAG: helix-turn-helix transcriptional regulator, partial [Actinobacteria bacterium]|nr:helix-turn-helix transcriptional regulator [Actinomycetota bacterium]
GFEETNLLINVAMVGAAVVFCVVVLLTARKPSPTSVYDVIFLLIGSALLLLPFLGAEYGLTLGIVVIVCTHFVSSAFLLVSAHAIHTQKANAYVVFGITEAAIRLFSLLGVLLGTLLFRFGSGFTQLTVFSFAGIYLLGMVLVVVLRRSKRDKVLADYMEESENPIQSSLDPQPASIDYENADAGISASTPFENRCTNLANQYNLTTREKDVLFYLVQGHTIARISGELFITANTVKTHVKMIHAKLDVHSKQELLDLFHSVDKMDSI